MGKKLALPTGIRRYRDRLLFALAYGAIIGTVMFAQPFGEPTSTARLAATQTAR